MSTDDVELSIIVIGHSTDVGLKDKAQMELDAYFVDSNVPHNLAMLSTVS